MSILKISRLGPPILLQRTKSVKDIISAETKKIILDMTETMLDAKGIGLAAPQVHLSEQIIIFRDLYGFEGCWKSQIRVIFKNSIFVDVQLWV